MTNSTKWNNNTYYDWDKARLLLRNGYRVTKDDLKTILKHHENLKTGLSLSYLNEMISYSNQDVISTIDSGRLFAAVNYAEILEQGLYQKRQQSLQQEMKLKRQIGTRICKRGQQRNTFIGYVERVVESKIQIRVSDSRSTKHSYIQSPGFKPSIIWDKPENWYVCE